MSFYVTGDTHGHNDIAKLTSDRFPDGKTLTKDDYVLICGDVAAVWDNSNGDRYYRKWFDAKPWTTLYVDGNHEGHDLLDKMPISEFHGGKVHQVSDSVYHLMRGQVYEFDGRTIFTMGGASSHDKEWRKEGVSWWAREMPSKTEYQEALDNLAFHDNQVDYVFTHCASSKLQKKIEDWYETDELTGFLKMIEGVKFKHWYFGHYHIDKEIDKKHTAVFNRVIKLW